MKILARIRVRETQGIRRFMYPLSISEGIVVQEGIDVNKIGMVSAEDGKPCPMEITRVGTSEEIEQIPLANAGCANLPRIEFAVSLAPFEEVELHVVESVGPMTVNDPLYWTRDADKLVSRQARLSMEFGPDACITSVVYDDVQHLRGPLTVTRNGESLQDPQIMDCPTTDEAHLSTHIRSVGGYDDDDCGAIYTELTACKSWVKIDHTFPGNAGDEIIFSLPLTVTAPDLLYDFGSGGGIYGRLRAGTEETLTWKTAFKSEHAQWSLYNGGRIDYSGIVSEELGLEQLWFHVIDGRKALACAITVTPEYKDMQEIEVVLTAMGEVNIRFRLGSRVGEFGLCGVCYHFLNDVPAISAATNPQSILLPPVVEVI